jgi:hypothetical protein
MEILVLDVFEFGIRGCTQEGLISVVSFKYNGGYKPGMVI